MQCLDVLASRLQVSQAVEVSAHPYHKRWRSRHLRHLEPNTRPGLVKLFQWVLHQIGIAMRMLHQIDIAMRILHQIDIAMRILHWIGNTGGGVILGILVRAGCAQPMARQQWISQWLGSLVRAGCCRPLMPASAASPASRACFFLMRALLLLLMPASWHTMMPMLLLLMPASASS